MPPDLSLLLLSTSVPHTHVVSFLRSTLVVAKTFPIDADGGGGVWTADAVAHPVATMFYLTSTLRSV